MLMFVEAKQSPERHVHYKKLCFQCFWVSDFCVWTLVWNYFYYLHKTSNTYGWQVVEDTYLETGRIYPVDFVKQVMIFSFKKWNYIWRAIKNKSELFASFMWLRDGIISRKVQGKVSDGTKRWQSLPHAFYCLWIYSSFCFPVPLFFFQHGNFSFFTTTEKKILQKVSVYSS